MRSTLLAYSALAVLTLSAAPAFAQEKPWRLQDALNAPPELKISGSIRARYEDLDRAFRPGAEPSDHLTSLRTLIFAEYDAGDIRIGGEVQDSRTWGGELGDVVSANDVNALEPIQAYIARDFKDPFGKGSTAMLQAGRMTLNLGSRRLIAADDYRNTTNGYTGLRFDAKGASGLTSTLIYTFPQVRLPEDQPSILDNEVKLDREGADLVLWGGIVAMPVRSAGPILEASYFDLAEDDSVGRPTRNRNLHTAAVRIIQNPAAGAFDYEAEYIGQRGTVRGGLAPGAATLDVEAELLHMDAGYTFKGPGAVRVSVEYDYVSGEDADPTVGRFDNLFGTRRSEFGPSGIYQAIGRTNLRSPGLRVEVTPSKRLDGFVTWRGLWADSLTDTFSTTGVRPPAGVTDSYAAQQIEGRVRYWLVQDATRLEFNGAFLFDKSAIFQNVGREATRYLSLALIQQF